MLNEHQDSIYLQKYVMVVQQDEINGQTANLLQWYPLAGTPVFCHKKTFDHLTVPTLQLSYFFVFGRF